MRTLSLDDLDEVGGGLSLGLLPQLTQSSLQPYGGVPGYTPGYPGLYPQQQPFDLGLGFNPGAQGFQQPDISMQQIGAIANQLLHTPVVSQLLGSITQGNPQFGQAIQGVVNGLQTGNIGAALPGIIGAFSGLLSQGQGQGLKF